MKAFVSIFLFLYFSIAVSANEKYTIIKVIGTILMQKTGVALASGDVIFANDPVVFKTPEAKASVMSSEKGRMVLSADGLVDKQITVKSSLIPPMSNIASRKGPILSISDVQNYFSGEYLLLNQANVKISKHIFPMNDSSFFFLTYMHNGQEVNKKLDFKDEILQIKRSELFQVDGKPIPYADRNKVKVGYYSGKQSLLINEMELITPDTDAFYKEVELCIKQNNKSEGKAILEDVVSFANEFYGKTDREQIKSLLTQKFGVQL